MVDFLKTILKVFTDDVAMNKRGFFTTFFKTTPEDYCRTDEIEIDIERSGAKVSPVITNKKTGAVVISAEDFATKKYKPPIMALAYPVDLYELMERQPGEKEYDKVGAWFGRLFAKLKKSFLKIHKMFKENIELQAAQILQSGELELQDENGEDGYTLKFPVKTTHFPTVATAWNADGAMPLQDLESLCNIINDDGKSDPAIAVFGQNAWNAAIKNADFKDAVKRDGLNLGALNPAMKNRGGRYMGFVDIGSYRLELWVYNDSYETLTANTKIRFMDKDKVIVSAALEDLDFRLVFGGVPTLGMKEPFTAVIPSEVVYENFMLVHNRVFEDEKGDTYQAESKSRPLCIPVSIDRFGCLTTTV